MFVAGQGRPQSIELAPKRSEPFEGAALVGADQARVARYVSREDGRQSTGSGSLLRQSGLAQSGLDCRARFSWHTVARRSRPIVRHR